MAFQGKPGLISQEVIAALVSYCDNPIILPLSNPTSRVEALPEDIIKWTKGKAIVATGSPFSEVKFAGQKIILSPQCNNSYIFPGIGLGVIASSATEVTDKMFMVASNVLAGCSPLATGKGKDLLPSLGEIRQVSLKIAVAVARQAIDDGVAPKISFDALEKAIAANFWHPSYRQYRRTSL